MNRRELLMLVAGSSTSILAVSSVSAEEPSKTGTDAAGESSSETIAITIEIQ
ncbi:hypothetical protein [Halorubrum persicum]|uniref:hypothetical protein n=1 Tax=Halorubrum persicum TaxID=1383844 RepID=UPI0015D47EAD|nr:hypothetical protein [Halorubrum persicum]